MPDDSPLSAETDDDADDRPASSADQRLDADDAGDVDAVDDASADPADDAADADDGTDSDVADPAVDAPLDGDGAPDALDDSTESPTGDGPADDAPAADAPADDVLADDAPMDAARPGDDAPGADDATPDLPPDVQKYERFTKMDGAQYDRVNEFLRERTYITAREWAIARLCADFRTETGVEMTKIGENLPHLIPFMTDTYTPQAVNQARSSFEEKVHKAGATFLYGAMSNFFTAEELDDLMYEVTEVAKFLLEVEGVDLSVEEELAAEDRISDVMREVRESSEQLRHDEVECPNCGHEIRSDAE